MKIVKISELPESATAEGMYVATADGKGGNYKVSLDAAATTALLAARAATQVAKEAQATAKAAIPATEKGAANGVATLGADGKVLPSQLPDGAGDVVEVEAFVDVYDSLPNPNDYMGLTGDLFYVISEKKLYAYGETAEGGGTTPESGKIYVVTDRYGTSSVISVDAEPRTLWWWDSTAKSMRQVGGSGLEIGEMAGTAYDGAKGKALADKMADVQGRLDEVSSPRTYNLALIDALTTASASTDIEAAFTPKGASEAEMPAVGDRMTDTSKGKSSTITVLRTQISQTSAERLCAVSYLYGGISKTVTVISNRYNGWRVNSVEQTADTSKPLHGLFLAAGVTYDAATGLYAMNGLADLTYDQLTQCYLQAKYEITIDGMAFKYARRTCRTNFFVATMTNASMTWYKYPDMTKAFYWSKYETLRVSQSLEAAKASDGYIFPSSCIGMFDACDNLKTVMGVISVSAITDAAKFADMFRFCTKLQDVRIHGLAVDISFAPCPLLSAATLQFLADNAKGAAEVTVTLHPDVYAKVATPSGEWVAVADAAAKKKITFKAADTSAADAGGDEPTTMEGWL